ncbi:hypothetical protein [Streptomyces sp. NBC_01465]|uniref:hypothetical protein n=1 Tax=Streptomyces sp. NBC_01465 TaxID=2903878 RepID=UPI002E3104AF|nr:hypothetical protein [Streptomyces sp. NBC_01465]
MKKWTRSPDPEPAAGGSRLSPHAEMLRDRFLAAPVVAAPDPWRPADRPFAPVGGLTGVGFGLHPDSGRDLLMAVSHNGHGLFDTVTGERIARDPEGDDPDGGDLACQGLGPLADSRIRIAGLYGGGLHTTAVGGWSVEVVSPDWPNDRVLLSGAGGSPYRGAHGEGWWHVFHSAWSELRAFGFSPSGRSLAVATSSDVTLWTRRA